MSTPIQVGADVAKTMASVTRALDASTKKALREVGAEAKKPLMAAATEVPGGDRRFSNMARYNHGGRLNVTTRIKSELVFVGSKGPWKIAEVGADPHRIRGGMHPGTRRSQGRASWSRAADRVLDAAAKGVPKTIEDGVEEAFGG